MALVYMNRLQAQSDILLTPRNLRPIILCSMMLASKVWDDTSMWNCDFCLIHPFFPLQLLNKWERRFLSAIGYDIFVSSKMYTISLLLYILKNNFVTRYAEYYFDIRAEEIKLNGGLETEVCIKPLNREKAEQLEMVSSKTFLLQSFNTSGRERPSSITSKDLNSSHERIILS